MKSTSRREAGPPLPANTTTVWDWRTHIPSDLSQAACMPRLTCMSTWECIRAHGITHHMQHILHHLDAKMSTMCKRMATHTCMFVHSVSLNTSSTRAYAHHRCVVTRSYMYHFYSPPWPAWRMDRPLSSNFTQKPAGYRMTYCTAARRSSTKQKSAPRQCTCPFLAP